MDETSSHTGTQSTQGMINGITDLTLVEIYFMQYTLYVINYVVTPIYNEIEQSFFI